MSVLPITGVLATGIITLSSFVGMMPPATSQLFSKEASKASTKEEV